jgi:hypothetical protein
MYYIFLITQYFFLVLGRKTVRSKRIVQSMPSPSMIGFNVKRAVPSAKLHHRRRNARWSVPQSRPAKLIRRHRRADRRNRNGSVSAHQQWQQAEGIKHKYVNDSISRYDYLQFWRIHTATTGRRRRLTSTDCADRERSRRDL